MNNRTGLSKSLNQRSSKICAVAESPDHLVVTTCVIDAIDGEEMIWLDF